MSRQRLAAGTSGVANRTRSVVALGRSFRLALVQEAPELPPETADSSDPLGLLWCICLDVRALTFGQRRGFPLNH